MSFKGSVPEEWKPLIMQTEQQCLWLRGLMPSRLTKLQDSYYLAWDGPEASAVERTGLFNTQLLDMSGLKFGTDGSGGSVPVIRVLVCVLGLLPLSVRKPHIKYLVP